MDAPPAAESCPVAQRAGNLEIRRPYLIDLRYLSACCRPAVQGPDADSAAIALVTTVHDVVASRRDCGTLYLAIKRRGRVPHPRSGWALRPPDGAEPSVKADPAAGSAPTLEAKAIHDAEDAGPAAPSPAMVTRPRKDRHPPTPHFGRHPQDHRLRTPSDVSGRLASR